MKEIVQLQHVTRYFGAKKALSDVSLSFSEGLVVGLVGENGAGKTTLIKHVLGLLRPQSGTVSVFGVDPAKEPVKVLSQIGYLSEETDIPGWMRIQDLMTYSESFYPTWDAEYARQLMQQFNLDPSSMLSKVSKGQRSRAGLVAAMAFRPALLVLDEPSSGLDPIVRKDILGAIIRTIAEEGRTVLFSSHLLSEVERVSDYLAMLRNGELVLSDTLERIKQNHSRVLIRFLEAQGEAPQLPGFLLWDGRGTEWSALSFLEPAELDQALASHGASLLQKNALSLDEIFTAMSGARQGVSE
ncbi:MAG: ABC transporter ATP-binding protein [Armatimonadetes bacterium]|nr:ABC transporter ATP-binding protein [Armatimonadota bacterium]